MSAPDDLTSLGELLQTARFGRVHEHHDLIGSTNDRAMAWLLDGGPDGGLVTADTQSAGRGRRGRSWVSPPGRDLYVSVLVRPRPVPANLGALSLAVGVGLREGLVAHLGERAPRIELKWPNDLLVEGRKLGGILCESRWLARKVDLVVGFGLNVGRDEFPDELGDVATSLALLLDEPPARAPLLADLLAGLERAADDFFRGGFPAIRHRYEPHCAVQGRRIRVPIRRPDGSEESILAVGHGLDEDGALLARSVAGGEPFRVESADVWLAPPTAG